MVRPSTVEKDFEEWAKNKNPTYLGRLLKEYIAESNYTSGWDGFDRRDRTGIRKFLSDLRMYHDSATEDDPDYFSRTSNINPL